MDCDIYMVTFGGEPSEMLETHEASIGAIFPLIVRAGGCPMLSLKALVACRLCHNGSDNLCSSRSLYSTED